MNERVELSDSLLAAMFRVLTAHSADYVSCLDRERRVLYLSRTLSRDLGSVLGRKTESFVTPEHREECIRSTEAAFASGEPQRMEIEVTLAEGGSHAFEIRIIPFAGPHGEPLALQVTTDLSERRRLTAQLVESEGFRSLIVENLPDYVALLDRELCFRWINRLAPGLSHAEVLGARIQDYVAERQWPRVKATLELAFESGQPTQFEVEAYGDGQQPAWYVTRVVPLGGGRPAENVLLITSDVTVRKRAELALRASEERFRALAERSPDVIAIIDRRRVVEYVNRPPARLAMEDVLGHRVDEFARAEELPQLERAIESVFRTGLSAEVELHSPMDDRLYRVRAAPFEWVEGGAHALVVSTNITRQRADERARESLQAQLHQAQRRESVGMLAGGIAHDFNNLLQVIQTNLHFAREVLKPTGLVLDELSEALRASERAAELTTHLLAIGRRQRVNPKNVELSALIEASLRMLRRVIPESIEVSFEPSPAPCTVSADPPQLEQVLLNLCLNARDAMPQGGRLEVRVHVVDSVPPTGQFCVTDSGVGIAPDHLKQIFEPFFTTKGAGSGLGLAVAAGIVAAHGGTISVTSEVGKGSKFCVELPLVAEVTVEKDAVRRGSARGDELILVAEDEPLVRAQAVRILKRAGYAVLEAEDGQRAVDLFEANPSIALVLLDVIMPGLDGWQAFSRIQALRAGTKVLFITGYTASALPQDFERLGQRLLSKPYKPQALLELVRDLLDER